MPPKTRALYDSTIRLRSNTDFTTWKSHLQFLLDETKNSLLSCNDMNTVLRQQGKAQILTELLDLIENSPQYLTELNRRKT